MNRVAMIAAILAGVGAQASAGVPQDQAHAAYRAQMAAAESAIRLGEYAEARAWFDEVEVGRRGVEWRWHDAALDDSLASVTLSIDALSLATSPVAELVACGLRDGTLELRDADTLAGIATVKAHAQAVTQIRFDRDGRRLVTCSYDRTVKVWSVPALEPLLEFKGHGFPVGGADFSADGASIVSCSYERPGGDVVGTVHVFDAGSGVIERTLNGGRKPLVALSVSPDGTHLATASWDFCLFTWPIAGGEARPFPIPDEGLYRAADGLAWSPDGRLLAGASRDHTARIWQAADATLLATLRGHTDAVSKLAFAPDGAVLATASADATLRLWNTSDWSHRARLVGHRDDVLDLAFTRDGARLLTVARDGTLRAWEPRGEGCGGLRLRASHAPYTVRFSPDGFRLAACSYDGRVSVWSAMTGEPLGSFQAHDPSQSCHMLEWSPDGQSLVTGSYDKTARVFDAETFEERARLDHGQPLIWLAMSADGRRLVTGGGAKASVWDLARRECLCSFDGHAAASLRAVAITADGERCASIAADGSAFVWNAADGTQLANLSHQGADPRALAFLAGGAELVVADGAGVLTVFDASTGAPSRELAQLRHAVTHLALAPDGSRLAAAAHVLALIDPVRGGVMGSLRPHLERPYHAAFSQDGERLASCSTDRSLVVADTMPLRERLARAADWRARRDRADAADPAAVALAIEARMLTALRGR